MRRNQLFSRASASWRQLHFPALGFGRVFISDWLLVCSIVLSFGNDSRYSTLWREKSFIKCRDVLFFSGHLVLYGRVRQDTNGLGEVMDARVWPSLQRQTDRWERHGELWQNSGRHHQESIRGLCFPLRNLFQQQSLPWLQDYFYMVQKKRENGSKWTLSTYIPLHWAYEIEAWVGNFIQITVFFQPKSRVCASVCRNTERSIVVSNKPKIHVQIGSNAMKSEMRIMFCIVSREVRNYNSLWK